MVNKRLHEGYYRDRLVILSTQEKSASTLHEVVILSMLRYTGGQSTIIPLPRSMIGGPLAMAGQAAFHFGLLLYFPNGGVCRGEFHADPHTIWMLGRHLGCRTVVLTRHPADRMVALYCMRREGLIKRMSYRGFERIDQESVFSNLFSGTSISLPANIGTLRRNLEWLESWVQPEAKEQSFLTRYEDMMDDAMAHFVRIHDFIYSSEMTGPLLKEIANALQQSGKEGNLQPGSSEGRVYPMGYSGKVGVWRDYLTPSNVETYNEVAKRFLEYSPYSDALLEIYPDLLLDPSSVNRR